MVELGVQIHCVIIERGWKEQILLKTIKALIEFDS